MDYTKLAEQLLQSMFVFHRSDPQKKIHDSMHGEAFVLQCIYQHAGELVPGEIRDIMDISSARIAATLNSLEKKALITRQIDASDRRRILIALTPAGKEAAEAHQRAVTENAATFLRLLGEHDAMEYVRITKKLAQLIPAHTQWH